MGVTYARAFVKRDIISPDDLLIVEKHDEKRSLLEKEGIARLASDITDELSGFDIVTIAVKPQDFAVMAVPLQKVLTPEQLVVSIMAGVTISRVQEALQVRKVVRAMPNTPAQLGYGITAFTVSAEAGMDSVATMDMLLETTGKSIFMKDESLLDAVTALSGSGPAYFYYFIRHMVAAGMSMGLDEKVSRMLATHTMLGSFHIMAQSGLPLDQLIAQVASKGGTTEAALNTFNDFHVGEHIELALQNAEKRAKELSKG